MISDHEILRAMFFAADKAGQELEGAHATVCMMDADKLYSNLLTLAKEGVDKREIRKMARQIADTKVMKVGHVRDFIMKLSLGDQPVHVKRTVMSEVFGPVGFNILPSLDKAMVDVRDAARLIPFLGFGEPDALFAPDLISDLSRALGYSGTESAPFGTMLVVTQRGERKPITAYDFFMNDPYLSSQIKDYAGLNDFQHFLRNNPISNQMAQNLMDFFDAPITVGVRDILRFMEGSRHPDIPWKNARQTIQTAFEHYRYENFLPREINYYTYWVHLTPQEVDRRGHTNDLAAKAFARMLVHRFPLTWTMHLTDNELERMALELLDAHFSYPVYDVEPYSGVLSVTSLKVALRLAFFLPVHLLNLNLPARRNPANLHTLKGTSVTQKFLQGLDGPQREDFLNTANQLLWETDVRGGVRSNKTVLPFQPIETTFYSIQDKAQSVKEPGEIVLEDTTLEDIVGRDADYMGKFPDLPEKLLVFFTLIYRYFLDTDFIPDLRPDKAGMDLFVRGIWGYKSKNLVLTGKQKDGNKRSSVMFIDNKDQFKQYQRMQDRIMPIGLAKYAMRLVGPLIEPAMKRSIGIFVKHAEQGNANNTTRLGSIKSATVFGVRYIAQVARSTSDGLLESTKAFVEDVIDDTKDGILSILESRKHDR